MDFAKNQQTIGGTTLLNATNREEASPIKFSDFAVVYRTHHLSTALQDRLAQHGIPYQVVGGESFFEQSPIAEMILVHQVIENADDSAMQDLLRSSFVKLSPITIRTVVTFAKDTDISIRNALPIIADQQTTPESDRKKLRQMLAQLGHLELQKNRPLSQLMKEILSAFGVSVDSIATHQLFSHLVQFDQPNGLTNFLMYYQNLAANEFYDPRADKITLSTIHAAKGLEFSHVFVLGFEDGIVPLVRENSTDEAIAEEQRLLYVAATRAKHSLTLLQTQVRERKPTKQSRFYALIKGPNIIEITDDAIAKLARKQEQTKKIKAQQRLFD